MKLAAYLRVSGTSQAVDGFGLDVQRESVADWAKRNEHEIVLVVEDAGVSGTVEGLARPGFRSVVESIQGGAAEGIIVYDLTRLARTLLVQETALGLLWDAGATVFTVATGEVHEDGGDDGTRKLIRQILGVISEYQKDNLVAKMAAGRSRSKAAGNHTDGPAPYGFAIEDRKLVPDDSEQEVLDLIDDARRLGRSYGQIADILAQQGYMRPSGGGSTRWYPATVHRLANRETPHVAYD